MKRFFFLLTMCAVATFSLGAQTPAEHALLLEPSQVWTAGEPLHTGWVVLIEGDEIKAVVSQIRIAGGDNAERVRDAADRTVDELFSLMKPPSIEEEG